MYLRIKKTNLINACVEILAKDTVISGIQTQQKNNICMVWQRSCSSEYSTSVFELLIILVSHLIHRIRYGR